MANPSQTLPETHVTCPGCQTVYSSVDSTPEHVRVRAFLLQVDRMYDKLREVKEWLRAGAPGRALEAAEPLSKESFGDVVFTENVIRILTAAIANFEKERFNDPGEHGLPMSRTHREVLAARILNSLFGTNL